MALLRIAGTKSAQSRRVACWEQMSNTERLYSVSDASLRWRPLVSTTNTLWNGSAASGSSGFSVIELNRFAVGVASAVSNLEALPKHNPHVMSGL